MLIKIVRRLVGRKITTKACLQYMPAVHGPHDLMARMRSISRFLDAYRNAVVVEETDVKGAFILELESGKRVKVRFMS